MPLEEGHFFSLNNVTFKRIKDIAFYCMFFNQVFFKNGFRIAKYLFRIAKYLYSSYKTIALFNPNININLTVL